MQHGHRNPAPRRPRRLLATLATAFAVLCAVGVSPTPTSAAEGDYVPPIPLQIGTYNIQANRTPAVFGQAVAAMLPRVDVLGLQEVNSKDKETVIKSFEARGWDYFRSRPGEQSPIMWNTQRFRFLSARMAKLADATWVGDERPGFDPMVKEQWATVVRLEDRLTAQKLSFVNTHLVAGAVKGGVRIPGRPRTFELYRTVVAELARIARIEAAWAEGRTYVMGDYNIGWVADYNQRRPRLPFATFKRQGMKSMWHTTRPANRGTRLTALLDQVYSSTMAADSTVEFDIEFSDHWPAIATYNIPVNLG